MKRIEGSPEDRFLQTFEIVSRGGRHLAFSRQHLFARQINAAWVQGLEKNPELAERLEAFVSRFGRMQDTIADKLLPRWLIAQAETPGSIIETLNRAERLGVVENVESWLEARALRNRLVHEYMDDPEQFAEDLSLANEYCQVLFEVFNRIREYAITRMGTSENVLPEKLSNADHP